MKVKSLIVLGSFKLSTMFACDSLVLEVMKSANKIFCCGCGQEIEKEITKSKLLGVIYM